MNFSLQETRKPVKIGFYFPHPFSRSLGSSSRLFSLACNLQKIGFDIVVITPFEKTQIMNGVQVINAPSLLSKNKIGGLLYDIARKIIDNKFLCRIYLNNLQKTPVSNKKLIELLQELDIDILQIEHEPTAVVLLPLLEQISLPVILDFQGIWAEELIESGVLDRKSDEYYKLQNSVAVAVSKVKATLVMSEAMKDYVVKHYQANPAKVHVIELTAEQKFDSIPQRSLPLKVIYAGILSKDKNADVFLESIPYIVKERPLTKFYITNKGDLIENARVIAKSCGAVINFFWFSDQKQFYELMATCHVGVFTLSNNESYKLSPSAKFFDYLSVGLPVVCNDIDGWTSIIKENQVGLLSNNNPADFSRAILTFLDNQELASAYGQRGLNLLREKFNATDISQKLGQLYLSLLQE